ncbi:MAG: hypothetical protein WEC59_07565, partial [Salibacteraceae bacterium]
YAAFEFKNLDIWPPQEGEVYPTEVTIIFTKYPKDKAFWLTDYHWLLAKRLNSLFELDSAFNNKEVEYSILLQTDCENEFEAMQLFHGMRVKYEVKTESNIPPTVPSQNNSRAKNEASVKRIQRFMVQEKHYIDSTVFKALQRNLHWRNATLVLDWTGSMYGYGAEALLWHAMNEDTSGINHVVYFNDGDRKKNRKKLLGHTGGIYISDASPVAKPIKLFNRVKNKGNGGDSPENDIEAIYTAITELPESGEVILIADNESCIRDYPLLECIDKPVRILLCGTKKGVNHQYVNLAWKTGGSIHTADFDVYDLHEKLSTDSLIIDGVHFTLTPHHLLMPTDRNNDKFGYCSRYYKRSSKDNRRRKRNDPKCYFKY